MSLGMGEFVLEQGLGFRIMEDDGISYQEVPDCVRFLGARFC